MFAIESVRVGSPVSGTSLKQVGHKTVSSFEFTSATSQSNITVIGIFNSPTEEQLNSTACLFGQFLVDILNHLQSDEVKKNIIDFTGKIPGSESVLVMLHGSFLSNMSKMEYYQLCENITVYMKEIKNFIYANISSSSDVSNVSNVPDVSDVPYSDVSDDDSDDEYDDSDEYELYEEEYLAKGFKRNKHTSRDLKMFLRCYNSSK
jgi:hypothetical protein